MNALQFRTRIAVLWVAVAVAGSGALLLYLVVPGTLEGMLAGEMEGATLDDALGFQMAMLVFIPVVMATVTLLTSERVSRYASPIVGLLFGGVVVFGVVSHLVAGEFDGHVLIAALTGFLAFLIAGLGAGHLRQPRSQTPATASEQSRPREKTAV